MFLIKKIKGRKNNRKGIQPARPLACLLVALGTSFHAMTQTAALIDTIVTAHYGIYTSPNKSRTYPVLYGTQTDTKLVQSLSFLKGPQLEGTPSGSILYGLTGRVAGLFTQQNSGEPNADDLTLSLRGHEPLILIDGIPRSAISVNPEQIESVTVLKDAVALAMLGIRARNGAVLITTKKGASAAESFSLNFKAQTGLQSPTKRRRYLGAYDFAQLYNEALQNDGKPAAYTQADLDAYRKGTDPYGHPDVDWAKYLLKDKAGMQRYTLNAEGNTRTANYFLSLDYMDQGGLLRESPLNAYSTNSTFKRYVFRSNIDVKIDEQLNVFVNFFGRIRTGNEPGVGSENILPDLNTTPNNAYPVYNPDGSFGGNTNYQTNIYAKSIGSGYYQNFNRDGFVDAGFKRMMNDVVEGWWVKGVLSYNTSLLQETNRSKQYEVFKMNIGNANDTSYQRFGAKAEQTNSSFVSARSQQFYSELSTGIDRSIGNNDFNIMLLANTDQYTYDAQLADKYKTLAANLQYSLGEKYILQVAAAYSGNNRFVKGHQYDLFPSAGLGWNLHKEKFASGLHAIDAMKLRVSYGYTGNAAPGYYEYITGYNGQAGYVFGTGAGGVGGIAEFNSPYERTWEKSMKLNVGLDLQFLQQRGWLTLDYFNNKNSDLLQTRGNATAIYGGLYPLENLGKNRYSGIELQLGWGDKAGILQYNISGNISTVKSKVLFADEPLKPYAWMQTTGNPVGQYYGYLSDGFITTAGQGPVVEGYRSVPGDLKYKDLNADGVINFYDQTNIGEQKPLMFYGLNTNLRIKNLYLNFLFQGVTNKQVMLTGNTVWEFQQNGRGQVYPHNLNRWTPATAATATYPRLTVGYNANNNVTSDFWLQPVGFLRLKNLEIGYDFAGGVLQKVKLKGVRIFANGLNLFTISSFDRTDPETPFAAYPVQRVVNAGISLTL